MELKIKRILVFLLSFLRNTFGINLFFILGIKLNSKSRVSRSFLTGQIQVGTHSIVLRTRINNSVDILDNCIVRNSTLNGRIALDQNVDVSDSNFQGVVKIGHNSVVQGASINGVINAEDNIELINSGITIRGTVSIGRYTSLCGPNFDIYSVVNSVNIGRFCSIARNVSFQEYHHRTDRVSTCFINRNLIKEKGFNDSYSNGGITVEHDVWIGTQCVILSGAHISTGAIVAANSVVNGFVPPYAIVGGSPAKVIKYRFSNETIELLLKSEWWNWDDQTIRDQKDLFLNTLEEDQLIRAIQ